MKVMKRKMKQLWTLPLLALVMLLMAGEVHAQKYTVAAGWRAGGTNGVTLKVVPVQGIAVEGIFGVYPYGRSLTALVQSSSPVFCIRALQVYAGAGGHYRFDYRNGIYSDPINGTFEVIAPPGTRGWGLDAVAGIELKLPLLPIAVSAEVKPMVEWTNAGHWFYGLDPGLGIKLAF